MKILAIRTDQPEASIALYEDDSCVTSLAWQAHRQLAETIHTKIEELLTGQKLRWKDLQGVAVYQGPGSFTGLRIGISVANATAYSLQVPVAGAVGDAWPAAALDAIQNGTAAFQVVPEYGAQVHITQPRK